MPTKTQPQPLMNPVQLRTATTQAESFAPITLAKAPRSNASKVLNTLNEVLPGLAREAAGQLNKIAQEDETRQASRALNGLEPEDDATKAGRTAHRMVGVRNTTNDTINQLNRDAEVFVGNQLAWENHVLDTQAKLMEVVGNDKDTLAMTGSIFREQLPKSHLLKFRADQKRDQEAKYSSTIESFKGALNGEFTEDEYKANVTQVIGTESKSMGLGKKQVEKALVDAAVQMSVENDDLRLINITKELGIFSGSAALQNANARAESRIRRREAGDIAIQKETLETEFMSSPTMTWETVAGKAQNQIDSSGNPIWTPAEIQSLNDKYKRAQVSHDKSFVVSDIYGKSIIGDVPGGTSVGSVSGIRTYPDTSVLNKADKKQLVGMYNEDYYVNINRLTQQLSEDPTKLNTAITEARNDKATWLASMDLVDDKWEKDFNIIGEFTKESADNLPSGELPDSLKASFGLFESLQGSPGTLGNHISERGMSISENFKSNMDSGGYTEQQALSAAITQADAEPIPMKIEERKKFNKTVKSETLGAYDRWFFTEGLDATDAQVVNISNKANARANVLMNTGVPKDKAIERAIAEIGDTHIQLSNGQPVYAAGKDYKWLAGKMRLPVEPSVIDTVLTELHSRLDSMADEPGMEDFIPNAAIGTESKDWTMEITTGGFIVYKDVYGFPVTKPIHLGEAAGLSINQMKQQNRDVFNSAAENRRKQEEAVASSLENLTNIN